MDTTRKILLVDDDADLLEVYQEVLKQLPGAVQVQVATSGAAAISLLEASPVHLLITDLRMPRMDGLQVLSIVRRKFPQMRTVVLTGIVDEQFRSRVYALGVDLYWQKPATEAEIGLFRECIQSLLERRETGGFRGLQSKSLMDIIQLECLSQSSCVLRIINGPLVGHIWINHGELVDAEAAGLQGEAAFQKVLSWKAGSFETLPAEPNHPKRIDKSCNALLLESAQAMDEAQTGRTESDTGFTRRTGANPLRQLDGFEFLLPMGPEGSLGDEAQALENAGLLANWSRATLARFRMLGDELQAGAPDTVVALGRQQQLGLTQRGELEFCTGWNATLSATDVRQSTKKAAALWGS